MRNATGGKCKGQQRGSIEPAQISHEVRCPGANELELEIAMITKEVGDQPGEGLSIEGVIATTVALLCGERFVVPTSSLLQ